MIVTEDHLKEVTGYSARGHLEHWLRANRIPYYRGKDGRLFTTIGLLESVKTGGSAPGVTPRRQLKFADGKAA